MRTCLSCDCLEDIGDQWICKYFMETTVNPDKYNADDCEYFKEDK